LPHRPWPPMRTASGS